MEKVKFKNIKEGESFIYKGITYEKINSGVARCPELFGKRDIPFSREIKVLKIR